jgi:hypothetical protein
MTGGRVPPPLRMACLKNFYLNKITRKLFQKLVGEECCDVRFTPRKRTCAVHCFGPKADIAVFMNARFNSKADMGNSRKRAERTLRMQRLRRRQQRPHSMHRDRLFDAPRQRMTTA